MVKATAEGLTETATGERVSTPLDLQTGWLMERWGIAILGPEPDFKIVSRASKALSVYHAFKTDHEQRSPEMWDVVKATMQSLEMW